jgi:hypothetical protein
VKLRIWRQKTNKYFKGIAFVLEDASIATKTKNIAIGEQSKQTLHFIATFLVKPPSGLTFRLILVFKWLMYIEPIQELL